MKVQGVVERGDARGRKLGFPTANISLTDPRISDGVWAALIDLGSSQWAVAAVSVGTRSTFYAGAGPRVLEAHLLDFNQDLYGRTISVYLERQLRPQRAFPTAAILVDQMHKDVDATRSWASEHFPSLLRSADQLHEMEI